MDAEQAVVYHLVVDRILAENLGGPGAVSILRRIAEQPGCDAFTRLLHEAARYAAERDRQLRRRIRHLAADLKAASTELAEGRCVEPLLTGRHDELLALAARHRDALTHLESLAAAVAERPATPAEPGVTP